MTDRIRVFSSSSVVQNIAQVGAAASCQRHRQPHRCARIRTCAGASSPADVNRFQAVAAAEIARRPAARLDFPMPGSRQPECRRGTSPTAKTPVKLGNAGTGCGGGCPCREAWFSTIAAPRRVLSDLLRTPRHALVLLIVYPLYRRRPQRPGPFVVVDRRRRSEM